MTNEWDVRLVNLDETIRHKEQAIRRLTAERNQYREAYRYYRVMLHQVLRHRPDVAEEIDQQARDRGLLG